MRKFTTVPPSVKIKKDGVEYLDNCDKAMYYIEELIQAALRDTGKFVVKQARNKLPKRSGKARKNTQYWMRKRDLDLQIGYKAGGFYGGFYELGTEKTTKTAPIYSSVAGNIETIKKIQAQYLSAMNDDTPKVPIVTSDDTEADG